MKILWESCSMMRIKYQLACYAKKNYAYNIIINVECSRCSKVWLFVSFDWVVIGSQIFENKIHFSIVCNSITQPNVPNSRVNFKFTINISSDTVRDLSSLTLNIISLQILTHKFMGKILKPQIDRKLIEPNKRYNFTHI